MQSRYCFGHSNSNAYGAYSFSRLSPFSNSVHVFLQFVQCFSETVCRLSAAAEQYVHLWLTCHRTQTQVALFARGFFVIDGYCQRSLMQPRLPTTFYLELVPFLLHEIKACGAYFTFHHHLVSCTAPVDALCGEPTRLTRVRHLSRSCTRGSIAAGSRPSWSRSRLTILNQQVRGAPQGRFQPNKPGLKSRIAREIWCGGKRSTCPYQRTRRRATKEEPRGGFETQSSIYRPMRIKRTRIHN